MGTRQKRRRKKFTPIKNIRLEAYKYKQPGAYAITICTKKRKKLFTLPVLRTILHEEWAKLPQRFPNIIASTFVVMHDHLHCMLILKDGVEHTSSVWRIIGVYKSVVSTVWLRYLYETGYNYPGQIWQRRFYDHIVRDEQDFNNQTAYILNNPAVYQAKQRANKTKTPT